MVLRDTPEAGVQDLGWTAGDTRGEQCTGQDGCTQLVVELARQRLTAVAREIEHSGQQVVHNWHQ